MIHRVLNRILALAVVTGYGPTAMSQTQFVRLEKYNFGTSMWNQVASANAATSPIEFDIDDNGQYRLRADNPSTTNVGVVDIDASGYSPTLQVGSDEQLIAPTSTAELDFPACNNLGGLVVSGNARVQIKTVGDIGNSGGVSVWSLVRADIGGAIRGTLVHNPDGASSAQNLEVLNCGSVAQSALIDVRLADLTNFTSTGAMLGEIQVLTDGKKIGTLSVGGDCGQSSMTESGLVSARGGIDTATIGGTLYGRIDAGSGVASPLTTNTDITIDGAMGDSSFVRIGSFNTFEIGGDIRGTIRLQQPIASGKVLRIGGSFLDPDTDPTIMDIPTPLARAVIQVPVGASIAGRIVINANNNTGGSWVSADAQVRFELQNNNPSARFINNSAYTDTASSLGGGSIGLVPYRLHGSDSAPEPGENLALADRPSDTNPILLRHYGQVAISGGVPFKVESRAIGSSNT